MSISERTRLTYTPLSEAHIDDIMRIEIEAYPEPWTVGMFREEIRRDTSHFYVALLDNELIGYGGYWLTLDEAHITSVTVKNVYRRLGYGRELLLFLLDTAHQQGVIRFTLEVRESNQPARQLYQNMGFRDVGLRKGYYSKTSEDAIVMMKELP